MVLGSHVILSAYGFWLPNDPRGSWSDFVGSWELYLAGGRTTRVYDRESMAHLPHDRDLRLKTKEALKRPPVHFTGLQAKHVGLGFAHVVRRHDVTICACSILPNHVHLVIGRHEMQVERICKLLKASATCELLRQGLHPFQNSQKPTGRAPHMWAISEWKVYLDSAADIERAIEYVEQNPCKEGKPRQRWSFVKSWIPM